MSESSGTGRSVTAVVPVYNEIESAEYGVRKIDDFLKAHQLDYEILLIESGSTDGTADLCDKLERALPNVRAIHEASRNGFGAAMMLGFNRATKSLVWTVPVDLPFPLEALLTAMRVIADHDAVISYRSRDERSLFRRAQSTGYRLACRWLLGLKVRSVNSAFKLLRRSVVTQLNITARGWNFDAELLYLLTRAGARLAEIPVPLIDRKAGQSTVTFMDSFRTLGALIALKCRIR